MTTDIVGKETAHALRLDAEATPELKKTRLHRKVATTILFESNGGQQRGEATQPEVRLAVAEPSLDIGHVEQCIEALIDSCYFLAAEKNRYRFSFQPNLNKLLADRRASVTAASVEEIVRKEIQKVFSAGTGIERVYFPKKSNEVADRPVLSLVVMAPENTAAEPATKNLISQIATESGSSSRTFKSALFWAVPEDASTLLEEARKLLAWKDIEADSGELKLDETQQRQLAENTGRAQRDLKEAVWRAYKNVFLLAEDNSLRKIDLGLVHSSMSTIGLTDVILSRLKQEDLVVDGVSPNFLMRYWPPALPEWSTKSVRDTFYASPKFPRLLKPDAVKDTISRGLEVGSVAYVGKASSGSYEPFIYGRSLAPSDLEIAEDVYLIARERAEEYVTRKAAPAPSTGAPASAAEQPTRGEVPSTTSASQAPAVSGSAETPHGTEIAGFHWTGEISPQKWMNFYTKVLSRFATSGGLKLTLSVTVDPPGGMIVSKVEETKVALRELGLPEQVTLKPRGAK